MPAHPSEQTRQLLKSKAIWKNPKTGHYCRKCPDCDSTVEHKGTQALSMALHLFKKKAVCRRCARTKRHQKRKDLKPQNQIIPSKVKCGRKKLIFTSIPFEQCRTYARSLKLITKEGWVNHCKEHHPVDMPINPNKAYGDTGWAGWKD